MQIWNDYFMPFVYLLVEMAPYLLLGFLIAGVMHAFVPKAMYRRYLGKNNLSSVLYAILFGVPLPLCSCGVIPTAVGMRKEGASKGATSAFLIATPQTGIDSILATYSVFGLPFALLRPVVAMITGFVGGIVTNLTAEKEPEETEQNEYKHSAKHAHKSLAQKCVEALDYGFTDMLMDIGQWLIIGIVLAGLITIFVPEGFFLSYQNSGVLNMFIVLLIACPMYVCATGSIPIAAALMLKGLSPGAALVFLMAGPATNMASMMVLGKTLGRRSLAAYLITIVAGAIAFGLAVDNLFPTEWFSGVMQHSLHSSCCHEEALPWWQIASTVLFVFLLVRALYLRHTGHACGCGEEGCGCHDEHCHCHDDHCDCGDEGCGSHDDHCDCGEEGCHCHEDDCDCGEEDGHCHDDHCDCDDEDGHCHDHEEHGVAAVALKVEGMMCNHCRAHVQEALENVEGAKNVSVDLGSGMARVEGVTDVEALIAAVESCGYKCTLA